MLKILVTPKLSKKKNNLKIIWLVKNFTLYLLHQKQNKMNLTIKEQLTIIYWYFFDWGKVYWYKHYLKVGLQPKYAFEKTKKLW